MALYIYVKAPPKKVTRLPKVTLSKKKTLRISAFICTFLGIILISLIAVPLFYYQFILGPRLIKPKILSPIPIVNAQESEKDLNNSDYAKASAWFPKATPQTKVNSTVSSYTLTIADLRIKDATVIIASEDLDKSLIHYSGTALPGQYGNTVIFGHSALPIFYDPKNYLTIFSTLHTLKKGAKITVNYDGVTYTYEVFDQEIIGPEDVSVLAQTYNDSYMSLITCYPPGTVLKRLVVKAKLVKLDN